MEIAIPSGAQLYYKRFLRGIPISGTFGEHLVKSLRLLCGESGDGKHGNLSSCETGFPVGAAFFFFACMRFRYWPHPVPCGWVLQGLVPVDTADNHLSSCAEVKYARKKNLCTSDSSYALEEYMGNPNLASFLNKRLPQKVTL